jgi:hypothetical protein
MPGGNKLAADSTYRLAYDQLMSAPIVKPQLDLSVGSGTRGENDSFGRVAGLAVDSAGRMYVWDTILLHVSVFDTGGNFLRTIGRKGEGPGEFNNPRGESNFNTGSGIAISHDTLFVLDKVLQAFDASGRYLQSAPEQVDVWNVNRITASSAGLLITESTFNKTLGDTLRHLFRAYRFGGGLNAGYKVSEKFFVSSNSNTSIGPRVPLPTLPFAQSEGGLTYFVVGDSFHINAMDINGVVRRSYIATPRRVPITHADVAANFASIEKNYRQTRGSRSKESLDNNIAIIRRGYDGKPRAKYREAINALLVSRAGDILLRRSDTALNPYDWSDPAPAEWTLISPTGRPIARLQLPRSFMPKAMVGCLLYGINQDDDGQDLLFRYHIPLSSCSQ